MGELEILAFLILSASAFHLILVRNFQLVAVFDSTSHCKMSALKKRKLNGPSLGAAPPKVKPSKSSVYPGKVAKPVSKPSTKPGPPPKIVESEDSEDQDGEEEVSNAGSDEEVEQVPEGTSGGEVGKKTFADLGVIDSLCEACENLKFKYPTPIQEQSIPLALEGRDM